MMAMVPVPAFMLMPVMIVPMMIVSVLISVTRMRVRRPGRMRRRLKRSRQSPCVRGKRNSIALKN